MGKKTDSPKKTANKAIFLPLSARKDFFYYSAFSERHFYLETRYYAMNSGKTWESLQAQWEENNRLFENDNPQRNEEAKKLGIEYLVQIDYSGVFDTDLSRELEECFRSSTVRIYHVQ